MFGIVPSFAGEVSDVVRVGITDNKFQNVLKQDVVLYATADSVICDKQTHKPLINIEANSDIVVKNTDDVRDILYRHAKKEIELETNICKYDNNVPIFR